MIIALAGSCWSSCCSTRNSRERCRACASDWLSPVALDVVSPHAVLVLTPAVTDSLSLMLCESLAWALREKLARDGSSRLPSLRLCPVLRDTPSLCDHEAAVELTDPVVLVYALVVVSVTETPIVSVSWESTKRCSVPSCSLAALASSAFPSRMKATAAFPRPSRCLTCGEMLR